MLKTKKELRKMFFDNFLGTIADNLVEANWALVMAWYPNVAYAQKITHNVCCNRYALGGTFVRLLCRSNSLSLKSTCLHGQIKSADKASKPLKNALYLVYLILTPPALISFVFAGELLSLLGVSQELLSLYVPYWQICVATIFLACPSQMLITSYLKATFRTRQAMLLDHSTTWTMAIRLFFGAMGF